MREFKNQEAECLIGYLLALEKNSLLLLNMNRKRQQTTFKSQHNRMDSRNQDVEQNCL